VAVNILKAYIVLFFIMTLFTVA